MKKLNLNDMIFFIILIFPLSTILQGITIFNNINKILIALMLLCLLLKNMKKKMHRMDFVVIFLTFFLYILSFCYTKAKFDSINDIFYFGFWILFYLYLKNNYKFFIEKIYNNKKMVISLIFIWNMVVFVSFFVSTSYTTKWGDGTYFKSFSNGEHRFASSCLFIIALSWLISQKEKKFKYMIFSLIPFVSIYLSGTRTYLGVILIYAVCIYYMLCKKKITFFVTLIPIVLILIFTISVTPMGEKFKSTNTEGYWGYWGTITNGRSVFWGADIKAFFGLDIFKQLTGNGYNFVYDVNEKAINARIWAHNDFINLIMGYGYIGLYLYLYVFLDFSRKILNEYKVNKIIKYGYYFIWFFNAMFNMVYTYMCSVLSLPFILYSMCYLDFKEISEEKNEKKYNSLNTNI